jgi:hypothetical protein
MGIILAITKPWKAGWRIILRTDPKIDEIAFLGVRRFAAHTQKSEIP